MTKPISSSGKVTVFSLQPHTITDNVHQYRGDHGDTVDLVLLEKLVGDLDHTLASHLVAMEIIADRDRIVHFLQSSKEATLTIGWEEYGLWRYRSKAATCNSFFFC